MGYHMHIPNKEAPAVSKILEIAAINELYVTKFVSLRCSIDNLKLEVIPYDACQICRL
jgi:hypothetical protein